MPKFPDGAAGLISTAVGLLAFGRMLLHGGDGVLTPATAAAMWQGQLTKAQRARGGLGSGFFDDKSWGSVRQLRRTAASAGPVASAPSGGSSPAPA